VHVLVPFAGTLVSLRLAAGLVGRWRERRLGEFLTWAASLFAFAIASAALTWGAAAGWDEASFKVYYLFGGLLTAALLGAGSLQRVGVRLAGPAALFYTGLCIGIATAAELTAPVAGDGIPSAHDHLDFFPARLVALVGNAVGTLAATAVAVHGLRRRPLGNGLILAGIVAAALGSALSGLGESGSAAFSLIAATLLYGGFVSRR
jgi:hypothetical protein